MNVVHFYAKMIPIFIIIYLHAVSAQLRGVMHQDYEEIKMKMVVDIIRSNLNSKGWTNFIGVGKLPDEFYKVAQKLPFTFTIINDDDLNYNVDDITPYLANTVIIDSNNIDDFETKFNSLRNTPYWHPHAHTIIYYRGIINEEVIGKMFFSMWYYQCCNTVLITSNDAIKELRVTHYSPYISAKYMLDFHFGCWTRNKIAFPISNFRDGFICEEGCHNVTTQRNLRENHLGTCIGFATHNLKYNDRKVLQSITFFEDKGKNLHGFPLTAYAKELLPFIKIDENEDKTYKLGERDGLMYTEMAKAMNFEIDLTPSLKTLKTPFQFESSIERVYAFAHRKVDLILMPVYLFDLVIIDVDMTVPFKDSGLCFMSHLADYETTLFDLKLLQKNYEIFLKFTFCFIGTWITFFIFNALESGPTFNQAGKDLSNALRSILSISLYKPPKREAFRIFLVVTIWSYFIMNFATQAAIISFFSAYKRGKNVDTFDDIVEKSYSIEGVISPDAMLPETEERYRTINSRLVHISDFFSCVAKIRNDSQRFCLIDCSVGRYFERNQLNDKGETYLHIARDQVHNHYLVMILHKNSALTDQFNKIMLKFVEAGLIGKWEAYRYKDIKYDVPVRALSTEDLSGIFICYCLLIANAIIVFILEILFKVSTIIIQKVKVKLN